MRITIGAAGRTATAVAIALASLPNGSAALQAGPVPVQGRAVEASYVLTNARVVVSPDRVIEGASIVIRDGRITEVGERVNVPADIRVLDLSGLTVYPGFVDAASSAFRTGARPGSGDSNLAPGRRAIDAAEMPEGRRNAWRAAGVTTAALAFAGGSDLDRGPGPQYRIMQEGQPLLPGLASTVNLGSGPLSGFVLQPSAAVQVGFGTRAIHEYPVTLMGSIAYVHQAFLDAAYQQRLRASGRAASQPVFRPEVVALERAAAGEQQVWFTVWQENNLLRAIDLAEELGLDYALLGAQEGFRITERIARTGRPVLLSLSHPAPDAATGRSFALDVFGGGGHSPDAEAVDAAAAEAFRGNAAALVAAGVPVALTSYEIESAEHFRAAVIDAVRAGLPVREALRALTVTPAQILGLDDRLGTIEAGKVANLVVVDGDFFTPEATVRQVFVQGALHDMNGAASAQALLERAFLPSAGKE